MALVVKSACNTTAAAQVLLENMRGEAFVASALKGYRMAECCSNYGGVNQCWLMVESEARTEADITQLEKRLAKQLSKAQSELLCCLNRKSACAADALEGSEPL